MAAATLTFPSQTLLKNVVDPVDGTDAATKEYVDNALSGGGGNVGAAGNVTEIQFNASSKLGASANLTFDSTTSLFTVIGNLVSTNANLGNSATANFFLGDGGLLTNVAATAGNVDFANNAGNSNYANYAGNVTISNQPNITTVGSLTNLTVSGNANIRSTTNTTGIETGALIVAGGVGVSQDVWIGGNLYVTNLVSQTHTTIGVTAPLLYLTADPPYPYSYEIGIYSHFIGGAGNTYQHTGFVRNHADGDWYLFSNTPEPSGGTVDLANANIVYDNLKLGDVLSAGNANIAGNLKTGSGSGGTISGANLVSANYFSGNDITTANLTVTGNTISLNSANITVSSGNAGIFNLGISNVSIGLAANVTLGSTSGNTVVRGNLSANNISTTSLSLANIVTNSTAIAVTNDTIIDSFPKSLYRSAKYIITAKNDDGYQSEEVLLLHDDSISFITIYGSLSTAFDDADIITVSSNIVGSNVCLYATGSNSNTFVNLISTYVTD